MSDMACVDFSILESIVVLDCLSPVTVESWFIRQKGHTCRVESYKLGGGSVVAYQENIDGDTKPLYMDLMFKELYQGEPGYEAIKAHAGVLDDGKILTFNIGR